MTSTGARGRYAIIPTHNRHEMVAALAAEMAAQVDHTLIIDNASDPPVDLALVRDSVADDRPRGAVYVMRDGEQPPNLSRLWQRGLAWAARLAIHSAGQSQWDVAILNDDAIIPPGWFAMVAGAMRQTSGAAAACTMPIPFPHLEISGRAPRTLTPWAVVIRGELAIDETGPLFPDARLRWWGGDNLLDIRAQQNGGSLVVPGPLIENRHVGSTTVGALAEQAGRDRETFKEIIGWYAW